MSAIHQVYQVTPLGDGRDVLVGDEMMTITTAENLGCGVCGGRLVSKWGEWGDLRWRLECREHGPVQFVHRYYVAMRSDGRFLPTRIRGGQKVHAETITSYGHRTAPYDNIESAMADLDKQGEALDGVEAMLATIQQLQEERAHAD